ncbi:MAG: hypothetical protein ACRCT2_04535, partial [Plesiomonas shigelloides]
MRVGTAVSNVKLALSEEDTLIALQGFARFKAAALRQERLSPADWEIVTEDEFDQYQWSLATPPPPPPVTPLPNTAIATPATSAPPAVPTVPYVAPTPSAAQSFKRGIKRDQSLFPVLKDEKDWDDWQRRLRTQATAQGV